MQTATEHRFRVTEYQRMAESGIFRPDARVELLDGKIIDMSPIGPFHAGVVAELSDFFSRSANSRYGVWAQNPILVDEYSEPQPDIVLVKRSSGWYRSGHPRPDDIYLAIEVSDTTLDLDREKKLPCYGRAGIAEAWIVNLPDLCFEIYRDPTFVGYSSKRILHGGEIAPQAFPDVRLLVDQVLSR